MTYVCVWKGTFDIFNANIVYLSSPCNEAIDLIDAYAYAYVEVQWGRMIYTRLECESDDGRLVIGYYGGDPFQEIANIDSVCLLDALSRSATLMSQALFIFFLLR